MYKKLVNHKRKVESKIRKVLLASIKTTLSIPITS